MNHAPILVAILGAESTGKTTLAQSLAQHFGGLWVPEYLRSFCEQFQRTPKREEQSSILETQATQEMLALVEARRKGANVVFCDTAPLMTAIYSDYIFADLSLYEPALALHEQCALTLVLENDIPWVSDGLQRDGEHVREPILAKVLHALHSRNLAFLRIGGTQQARLDAATEVIGELLVTAAEIAA